MAYDFDTMVERRGTGCSKWDGMDAVFGKKDLLPFWVADMDFRSAPEIIDALREKVAFGVFGYPIMTEAARKAVVDWEFERHQWCVVPSEVDFVPGVVNGLIAAILAFTEPGDGVVVQTPVYPPFFNVIRDNGRRIVENPLVETDDGYLMDLDHLRNVLTPDVKAIILCSPHNPVARVWTKDELAAFAKVCIERNVLVFCDEIHQDLVYSDAKHVPLSLAAPEIDPLLLTLVAPSKTFNIAGLSSSAWIAKDKKIAERMRATLDRLHQSRLNLLGVAALEAAYTKGIPWLEAAMRYLEGNRDFVEAFLREKLPRVRMKHPEGTFIFWLDFRDYGMTGAEIQRVLVHEAGVALNAGVTFGKQGEGFARLNVGCPRGQLEEGMTRIAAAFEKYGK
ncbi:pyridoxal phosphate-dependent aminotransferase [Synergistaceae bacterium OttesenSCG-928-I11]|nr:pyridoxal phosphate-dependent aminotransferase [Synergistaceae bacterium OttesenSCG-928-I11]